MTTTVDLFSYFLNLLLAAPVVFLVRAILPYGLSIRLTMIGLGASALFAMAPRFVLFYFLYWTIIWLLQYGMRFAELRSPGRITTTITAAAIVSALLPMAAWKLMPDTFTPWMTTTFSRWLWELFPRIGYADALVGLIEPLGLSFAVFRAIDLLMKVRLNLLPILNLERVLFFGLFPPILALGPVMEYEEARIEGRVEKALKPGDLAVGLFRFALGCLKIFLIGYLFERYAALMWRGGDTWQIWLGLLAYTVYFYINFSGFSDLAIGVARIYGFTLKENFDNPFFKTNPQAFWNSWHMSLTRWAQRYVYVPMGGMRANSQYVAIVATMMVIALWHNVTWPLLIFGIYHGAIMVGHRWLQQRPRPLFQTSFPEVFARPAKIFAVFFYVALSIPLLSLPDNEVLSFYKLLLGQGS